MSIKTIPWFWLYNPANSKIMNQVKGMLFDLDGTLIDSRADLARSINMMLADLDRAPLDESLISGFVGDGVWVLVYRALRASDPSGQPPDEALHKLGIATMRRRYSDQMLVSTRLFPGVRETLQFFRGKQFGLVTSKETDLAKVILEHFEIAGFFNCVVGGDQLPERKPDAKPVFRALDLLGLTADAAVMIGDSENDVVAGKRAGTMTCGATFGFRTEEQILRTEPDVVIRRFDDLTQHFS